MKEDIIESISCTECGAGLFYIIVINKIIYTLCRSCGTITNQKELQEELKKEIKKVEEKE